MSSGQIDESELGDALDGIGGEAGEGARWPPMGEGARGIEPPEPGTR